ncbi:PREDICTED: NADH dehydrogenase [ubiquinone] 1 beta subcomplex subunit 9 [Charadrius vociferus]|nr:PREDICTED: NADH dehydrogenase [ubiquinone] 1 beta subcomplex subunit 9 [Charadrius vociferus]
MTWGGAAAAPQRPAWSSHRRQKRPRTLLVGAQAACVLGPGDPDSRRELTHQQKVLRLYKKSLRHLESWCIYRDKYRYFACLLRERFDKNKDVKDMVKATELLKAGEEEFWANQHPQPYIFPDSPGGTSYERYECYKIPEWCLDFWHPSEKAMYPDYFAKREQWKKLQRESWEKEIKQLEEETPADGPRTEALPPARKEGHLPPLWWQYVTRPREIPM